MKLLIYLTFISFAFSSCKKEHTQYFISGHLLDKCSGVPVKNQALDIYQTYAGRQNAYGVLGNVVTDSTGYFKIYFTIDNIDGNIQLRYASTTYRILELPAYGLENLENINMYGITTCSVTVKLNVTNPYTANDTLYITDLRYRNTLAVPGPFVPGTLYTANNFQILLPAYPNTFQTFGYVLPHSTLKYQDVYLTSCENNIVTVDVK